MATAMNGASPTLTSFRQESSFCNEAAMEKRAAAECLLSSAEGTLSRERPTDEMAGAVQVRKRSKRSSSVQLMEVVFDPNTPPAKDLVRKSSSSKGLQPADDVRRFSTLSSVLTSEQLDSSPGVGFDVLPWELKLQVLQHLSAPDLCRLSQVNRSFRALASCDPLWAILCFRSSFSRATLEESWKWNFMAATIGIVHAKLLDDSNPSHVLRVHGDAYIIDPMHAFFTADRHRWRWTHEVLPILETLQNADVILTYRGRQCAVIQTRFGEGAYQVTRRRRPVGTVFSASGFLAIIPRALMELLREEDGIPTGSGSPTGTGTLTAASLRSGSESGTGSEKAAATENKDEGSEKNREKGADGILVRNLNGTLFTSRTGDFLVSAVRSDRGTMEEEIVGLDVPVDLLVTTGGDWSTDEDEEDEDEELDEDDLRFLESAMRAEKAPAAANASSCSQSSMDDSETSQDCSCISASERPA